MNIPVTLLPNRDGSFTVVSNVFHFVTEGETMHEALQNAREAAECHVEGLKKANDSDEKEYLESVDEGLNTFIKL